MTCGGAAVVSRPTGCNISGHPERSSRAVCQKGVSVSLITTSIVLGLMLAASAMAAEAERFTPAFECGGIQVRLERQACACSGRKRIPKHCHSVASL